jgi:uncharacterized damage-inducible protein DinB
MTTSIDTTAIFQSLNDCTSELVQLISSFSEDELNRVPFENSWTAAQVADHLTKSNGIVKLLTTEGRATERAVDKRVQELKELFLDFSTKLNAPAFVVPASKAFEKGSLEANLERSIALLKNAATKANLYEAVSDPALGELTKLEVVHFVVYHTQRHIQQFKNILKVVVPHKTGEMMK